MHQDLIIMPFDATRRVKSPLNEWKLRQHCFYYVINRNAHFSLPQVMTFWFCFRIYRSEGRYCGRRTILDWDTPTAVVCWCQPTALVNRNVFILFCKRSHPFIVVFFKVGRRVSLLGPYSRASQTSNCWSLHLNACVRETRAEKIFVVWENGGWSKWRNYKLRNLNLLLTKYWFEYQKERRHFEPQA